MLFKIKNQLVMA